MFTRSPGSLEIKPSAYKVFPTVFPFVWLSLSFFVAGLNCLGYTTTIAASYGDLEQVCAIEANGEQIVLCWGKNSSQVVYPSSAQVAYSFAVISGGSGFMCGLKVGTYSPYCWAQNVSNASIIPDSFANFSYSTISAGEQHVCAIRSMSNEAYPGGVDCWGTDDEGETIPPADLYFSSIVAGRRYTCGLDNYTQYAHCWGAPGLSTTPNAAFKSLSAGTNHVCGILKDSNHVQCWGDNSMMQATPPINISLVAVTSGLYHSCGITADTHEVVCWGDRSFGTSSPAPGASFLTLTSAPNMTCGIREDNLLAVCWGSDAMGPNYSPPLELFSPGICTSKACGGGTFHFNASTVVSIEVSGYSRKICLSATEQICAPCAWSCPAGQFLSGPCSPDADRSCSYCSLCTSESCRAACDKTSFPAVSPLQSKSSRSGQTGGTASIIGAAVSGGLLVTAIGALVVCVIYSKRFRYHFWGCASREKLFDCGGVVLSGSNPSSSTVRRNGTSHDIIRMQAFRLAELRDATNGFKELNELGRGSYGFVYKALLPDGRQVAVKRANAARRIQSRSRDFEAELEVLCKVHHAHLVNLVGYCEEMGERLLVYEFMPHGTLHDHLHGGLAQLNWHLRLKVAAQAARGVEYLHKDASPKIIHRDIKSSNVLLDGEWGARVADFGLTLPERERGPPPSIKPSDVAYVDPEYLRSQNYTEKSDVYSFGVVLLEILCGRKAYDSDFDPPNIVAWATPYIRQGKTVQILDQSLDLPKNVEPLLRVAEIVELCVRFSPQERPSMSDVASWLELVGRSSSL